MSERAERRDSDAVVLESVSLPSFQNVCVLIRTTSTDGELDSLDHKSHVAYPIGTATRLCSKRCN